MKLVKFVVWCGAVCGALTAIGHASSMQYTPAAQADQDRPALSAAEALASFVVEPGYRIDLVVAEPLVQSPVAIAFDDRGRMYVAENRGYPDPLEGAPPAAPQGVVALLTDTNGDGWYETRTNFATGLTYPNGVMAWDGGVFVTMAPDLLYLKDTTGDGVADERRVVLTGFNTNRTAQIRFSHPTLGPDGWIYLTAGLNGGRVTSPAHPERPAVEFTSSDSRFNPRTGEFELAGGQGQYGLGQGVPAMDEHAAPMSLGSRLRGHTFAWAPTVDTSCTVSENARFGLRFNCPGSSTTVEREARHVLMTNAVGFITPRGVAIQQVKRGRVQCAVEADDVRLLQQGRKRHLFEPGRTLHMRIDLHQVGAQQPHSESRGAPRDSAPAIPDADDAQDQLIERPQLRFPPETLMHLRVHSIELPHSHQHVAHYRVRHRLAERVRRIAHNDAATPGALHVD